VANRLWHRLMGRGIVHPVDSMGTRPWNEDLLDQLAVHLSDSGYDLKKTLELIATSQIYGLESAPWDESAPAEDFVFAGPSPKRLTAEQFVDSLAGITGVAPEATENNGVFVDPIKSLEGAGERPFVRASLVQSTPLMRTLGRPNREQVVTTRPGEVTTLEALELSNGEPLSELLAAGGQKLASNLGDLSPSEISRTLVRAALSREPTDEEQALLVEAIGDEPTPESLADALWCIVMLPEFQLVR
jgi:hypothetical protein